MAHFCPVCNYKSFPYIVSHIPDDKLQESHGICDLCKFQVHYHCAEHKLTDGVQQPRVITYCKNCLHGDL